jgi:microcystin-dependent protein
MARGFVHDAFDRSRSLFAYAHALTHTTGGIGHMENRSNLVLSVVVGGLAIHGVIAACGKVVSTSPDARAADTAAPGDTAAPPGDMGVPPGTIVAFGGITIPTGWALCDGSEVSRTTYASLFAAVGISYGGGDGINSFNLPDLRGRAAFGAGQGPGLTNRVAGQRFGEESHTLTVAEMPSHRHLIPNLTQRIANRMGAVGPADKNDGEFNTEFTDSQGGDQPHNNMPPAIALNFIIKY